MCNFVKSTISFFILLFFARFLLITFNFNFSQNFFSSLFFLLFLICEIFSQSLQTQLLTIRLPTWMRSRIKLHPTRASDKRRIFFFFLWLPRCFMSRWKFKNTSVVQEIPTETETRNFIHVRYRDSPENTFSFSRHEMLEERKRERKRGKRRTTAYRKNEMFVSAAKNVCVWKEFQRNQLLVGLKINEKKMLQLSNFHHKTLFVSFFGVTIFCWVFEWSSPICHLLLGLMSNAHTT